MTAYKGKERRKFRRVKVRLVVVYRVNEPLDVRLRIGDQQAQAAIDDISEGGIAVLSENSIPPQTHLWVRFTLALSEEKAVDFFGTIELLGQVCYCKALAPNKYKVGVKFLNIDDNSKGWIADFINILETKI